MYTGEANPNHWSGAVSAQSGLKTDDENMEQFWFLVNAPALFNAVVSAEELGIFDLLRSQGGLSTAEISQALELPSHQARVLLFAVATTGLLVKAEGRFDLAPVSRRLFDRSDPGNWGDILRGWRDVYYPAFSRLTESVRAGTNVALDDVPGQGDSLYERIGGQPVERVFHRSMAAFTLQSMESFLQQPVWGESRRVLDVGGGDGTTAAALVKRYPNLEVVVLDRETVTNLGGSAVVAGQAVEFHGGDLFEGSWPTGHDVVNIAHVLEVFNEPQILVLLARAFESLAPGGRVVIYGYTPADDETTGWFSARLSLYLNALASGQGMAYSEREYTSWLQQVGFTDVHVESDLEFEHSFISASKPLTPTIGQP